MKKLCAGFGNFAAAMNVAFVGAINAAPIASHSTALLGVTAAVIIPHTAMAQAPATQSAVLSTAADTLDEVIPSGVNFDKAEFRFWVPPGVDLIQAIVVLVPGSNGDGRSMAQDTVWQAYATKHKLALVACRFTDKKHDQGFIEEYVNVSKGSGEALLTAITKFAKRSKHAEVAAAPLFMWGMSAGGQFNYEFAVWKPDRVAAFVVNKGGIYYTALVPQITRSIPAILFVGEKDLEFRTNTIAGIFAVNRRAGAVWAYAPEPDAAHIVGRSRDVAMIFFEDMLSIRFRSPAMDAKGNWYPLNGLEDKEGYIGDLKTKSFAPIGTTPPTVPTAWLATERIAKAWKAMVNGTPFER